MKNRKSNFGFSYIENMTNFEAFCWNFSSSTNLKIGRSDTSNSKRSAIWGSVTFLNFLNEKKKKS